MFVSKKYTKKKKKKKKVLGMEQKQNLRVKR